MGAKNVEMDEDDMNMVSNKPNSTAVENGNLTLSTPLNSSNNESNSNVSFHCSETVCQPTISHQLMTHSDSSNDDVATNDRGTDSAVFLHCVDSILEQLTGDDIIDRLKRRIQSGALRAYMKMPEKDDIDCQEKPELFHDYYGIKINKDYFGIDVKHPNDILLTKVFQRAECHTSERVQKVKAGEPKILFEDGIYKPKMGVFEMLEANETKMTSQPFNKQQCREYTASLHRSILSNFGEIQDRAWYGMRLQTQE
ncbi:hypothetical protein BATDEDRAFT_22004 [Batrachochytrium dendrobatidis JAM81]|uniref:Uncharacterized protein n=1 Tax=Batrachochytrium dendrobatidis (strain JAM81 / FGSC 10211) TaxID=684364 RepID=F4NRT4_BATDJ|nr:uncharacterized protein BATDEDRAFT_22004 [Batrachochytrium dendrobatidis JAM81]EGF83370.1 hypothetical protein BATDEDRAFT_22004 [Batrachochytrium dendrobatidis JAM81]|eukprot:XP_006675439.1 hypothetical protein BATDEDRAFT_22004 [Batrachochytrium dendrobatidis JAM81]